MIQNTPEWEEAWAGIGVSTERANRPQAEAAIRKLYELTEVCDGKAPEILWVDSPDAAIKLIVEKYGDQGETPKSVLSNVTTFNAEQELACACGWVWMYYEICVATERPSLINVDDKNRPHCESGPAILFPDGWGSHCVHGVRVPEQVVVSPKTLTDEQINNEPNTKVQQIMRERRLVANAVENN